MRYLLIGITAAIAAIVSPVRAQAPAPGTYQPQWPPAAYSGSDYQPYPLLAPTPRDAYRDGTINRWEYERLEGPLPEALQGPNPDGRRGGGGGGS
jgi:hypothetical protein